MACGVRTLRADDPRYERDIPHVTQYAPGYLTDLNAFLRRTARRR